MTGLQKLRERTGRAGRPRVRADAARLGPAGDDALRGRRRPRRAARHGGAAEPRAGTRRASSASGWPSSRAPSSTALDARHRAARAPRLGARAAGPGGARRRARPRRGGGPAALAGRRGPPTTSRCSRRRSNATCALAQGVRRAAWPRRARRPTTALLGDYDFGLRARRAARACSARSPRACRRSWARRERYSPPRTLEVPVAAQQGAVAGTLARLGVEAGELARGRLRAPLHRLDRRGRHARDDPLHRRRRRVAAELAARVRPRAVRAPGRPGAGRTNLGRGTSMSVHESQSKLWENHVARSAAFAELLARRAGGRRLPDRAPRSCTRRWSASQPLADPGVGGRPHLPAAHHPALRARAGADRRRSRGRGPPGGLARGRAAAARPGGPLRRARLPAGRALGRGQLRLLPQLRARVPDRGAAVGGARARSWARARRTCARGEVGAIQAWLGERVHRYGRRLDTTELVERATGAPLSIDPFIRYVEPLAQPRP